MDSQTTENLPITAIWPGQPYPRGATWDGEGVNFSIFSGRAAKVEGLPVTAEAAPHHMLLTHDLVATDGASADAATPTEEP